MCGEDRAALMAMAVHALFSRCRYGGFWHFGTAWLLAVLCWLALPNGAAAQYVPLKAETLSTVEAPELPAEHFATLHPDLPADSVRREETPVDTALLLRQNEATMAAAAVKSGRDVGVPAKAFVPNPQRALWLALVAPGAGQIYNRKYWKLPLFYGGFLGCTYAFLWNQQMFMDYSQAYLDIMDDDPNTASYRNFFPPGYDIDSRLDQFKTVFKNRKDRFRRYRDLSAFCFIGVYLLSVVDAYVDAQLSVFDISPDLSLRVAPALIETNNGRSPLPAMGLGATFTF